MMYDETKMISLEALKALGARVDKDFARKSASDTLLNAMYRQPQAAQYRTRGNLTAGGTGDITDEALADLLGNKLGSDLTFIVNGVTIGTYTGDTVLSAILSDINANEAAGVQAVYDKAAQEFVFTAKGSGENNKIELGDGLALTMFGGADGGSFAGAYGIDLGADGSKWVTFALPDIEFEISVADSDSTEDVAQALIDNSLKTYGYDVFYHKTSGQIIVTDEAGGVADMKVSVDGNAVDPGFTAHYTPGRDAVFTDIKVNGVSQPVEGGSVNIEVPCSVSELDNDKNYQTGTEVAAAIAAAVADASNLKRKIVDSVDDIDPSEAGAESCIYMVKKADGEDGDLYDEYMVLDGKLERVGSWKVNLSDYVQKEEGAGLYPDADKEKLAGVSEGANKVTAEAGSGTINIDGTDVVLFKVATDAEVAAMLDEVFGG